MTRMVHNRLCNLAKTRGWLCSEQAGFGKLRSFEDQILRTTQTIGDGFQATKPQRSLMALLDFSKAFDRVWREELLLTASPKGLQRAVTAVAEWITSRKTVLNADKFEVTFFSTNSHEPNW